MGQPCPREYENSRQKLCIKVFVFSLILAVILSMLVLLLADSAKRNLSDQNKNKDIDAEMVYIGSEGDSVWIRLLRISDLIPLKSRKKRFLSKVAENLKLPKPASGTSKPVKDGDKKTKKSKVKSPKPKHAIPGAPAGAKQANPLATMIAPLGGSILQADKPADGIKNVGPISNLTKLDKPKNDTTVTTKKPEINSETPAAAHHVVIVTPATSGMPTEQKIQTTASSPIKEPATHPTDAATILENREPTTTHATKNTTPEQPVRIHIGQKQKPDEQKPKVNTESPAEEESEEINSKETDVATAPSNNELSNGQANNNPPADEKTLNIPKAAEDSDLADNSIAGDHLHPPISDPALDSEIHWRHQNINPEPGRLPFTVWSPDQDFHFHRFLNKEGEASDSDSSSSSEEKKQTTNSTNKVFHFHRFQNNETSAEFNGTSSSSEEVEEEIEKLIKESEHDTKPLQ